MAHYFCAQCGKPVPADDPGLPRVPCPTCGSTVRNVHETLTATQKVTATLQTVVTRLGRILKNAGQIVVRPTHPADHPHAESLPGGAEGIVLGVLAIAFLAKIVRIARRR